MSFGDYILENNYICKKYNAMYRRIIQKNIKERSLKGKAIVIIGARQVGKTTLI